MFRAQTPFGLLVILSIPLVSCGLSSGSGIQVTLPLKESEITVPVGESLEFVNESGTDQSVTSVMGIWDSGRIRPGGSVSQQFLEAGSHEFVSVFDRQVRGVIHVKP